MRRFKTICSHVILFFLGACATVACREGLDIKIWFLDAQMGKLVRKQNPVDPIRDCSDMRMDEYRCMSPDDFQAMMNWCDP